MRKLRFMLAAVALFLVACHPADPRVAAHRLPPIVFEMRSFETIQPGCGDHGSRTQACVSFRVVWPVMKGGSDVAVAQMNATVLAAIGFPGGADSMAVYANDLVGRWRVEHRGVVYADSSWFERRMLQVLARRPGVWSFQVDRLGQTGKSLPFAERSYLNLDPQTGHSVALSALLTDHADIRFASLAEARLRSTLGLASGSVLPLKAQPFSLPAQFAFSPQGVLLAWSGEELRDAASARIEITLPWGTCRDLLNQKEVQPPTPEAEPGF